VNGSANLEGRLFRAIHPASLAVFRMALGCILMGEVVRDLRGTRIAEHELVPSFHFKYLGFEWIQVWSPPGLTLHFGILGLLAASIAVGLFHRLAALLFFVGFSYVFLLDQAHYLNHFYLVILLSFLLIFVPAHHALSLDSLWWGRRPVPHVCLLLLRGQIGLVYLFAGIAKLNPDWLRAEPLQTWLRDRSDIAVLGPMLELHATAWIFSYGALLLDLLAWPLLSFGRTRTATFMVLVGFHLMNSILFGIGIFPWVMIAATTLFFPPDWPVRLWPGLERRFPPPSSAPSPRRPRTLIALVTAYLMIQVLVPLRHLLYPGRVDWTEQGHRFSWHMMLRSKEGKATFRVRDPASGESWMVDPRVDLTEDQARKMAGRPDMILQYAHFLTRKFRADGHEGVEVRVTALVTLNDHPARLLVDPEVDLAREKRTIWPAPWILPLSGEGSRPR
jgi:hypothetical protein